MMTNVVKYKHIVISDASYYF